MLSKTVAADLVTETDKAVEDMVSNSLKSAYPDYLYGLTPPEIFKGIQLTLR